MAFAVLAVYGGWIGAYLATGNDVRDFVGFGRTILVNGNLGQAFNHPGAPQIHPEGYRPSSASGYDGQFSYYLAVTPEYARSYMDDASYRYSRILQPMLARALALGDEDAIPYALVFINWLAAGLGTLFLALWLERRGVSRWFALLYGLCPGLFIGVQRDVAEPVAYALVALGVLLLDDGGRWRLVAACIAFGLAGLARQATLLFPLVFALWIAFGGELPQGAGPPKLRRRKALLLFALSAAPYLAYSLFLHLWLGSVSDAGNVALFPFQGLVHHPWRLETQGVALIFVVLPALIALVALRPRRPVPSLPWLGWFLVLANVLVSVVFFGRLYQSTYTSMGRVALGIVLASLLCLPYVDGLSARRRESLVAAAVLAVVLPFPVIAVNGFAGLSS